MLLHTLLNGFQDILPIGAAQRYKLEDLEVRGNPTDKNGHLDLFFWVGTLVKSKGEGDAVCIFLGGGGWLC